jgi:hypothetical protein
MIKKNIVADPECVSRILIFIIHSGSRTGSRIPDPTTTPKEEGDNFLLFTQKFVIKQKYGFGIRDPEKTYLGSRIQGQKGSGSQIRIHYTDKKQGLRQTCDNACPLGEKL